MTKLLLTIALLLWAVPTWAVVTFDSTFEQGFNAVAKPQSFNSNTGNVTGSIGANSNRVLICSASFASATANLTAVTMTALKGGSATAMTPITSTDYAAAARSIWLFGMIAPDTGNQTIVTSWTSGAGAQISYVGCISTYNADQVSGWQNAGVDTGTGTAASSTVTTTNGNLAMSSHGDNNASSLTFNQGTQAWIDTRFTTNAGSGYVLSSGGTAVVSWTLGSSVAWGHVKVDVISLSSISKGGAPFIFP